MTDGYNWLEPDEFLKTAKREAVTALEIALVKRLEEAMNLVSDMDGSTHELELENIKLEHAIESLECELEDTRGEIENMQRDSITIVTQLLSEGLYVEGEAWDRAGIFVNRLVGRLGEQPDP